MSKQTEITFQEIWWCEECHQEFYLTELNFYGYKDGVYPLYYCNEHFPNQ